MIRLKKDEVVAIFQAELVLKVKAKQNPFIAILIFAHEQEGITAESLQEYLLSALPLRACMNLLIRLEQQGYLERNIYYDSYELTQMGEENAINKSFWIGEKGVYNIYMSRSNLIQQRIIKIEKVERAEDSKGNSIVATPREIRQYENQIIKINETDVLIEDVEDRCFQLKPENCILDIQARENETLLNVNKGDQLLFQTNLEVKESILKEELLSVCDEFEYDLDKRAILIGFSKNDLSFNRKVKITKPIFGGNQFNQVELENISHIPVNKQNAELWYWELLFKNMNNYFLNDNSFNEFATEFAKPIQLHFKVKIPNRKELAELFSNRNDAFYKISKLETIDYLNY